MSAIPYLGMVTVVSRHPKPPKKFPVRKRRSQSQARRKADERRRKRARKRLAVLIAEAYRQFGTMTAEEAREELDRRELRRVLEERQG